MDANVDNEQQVVVSADDDNARASGEMVAVEVHADIDDNIKSDDAQQQQQQSPSVLRAGEGVPQEELLVDSHQMTMTAAASRTDEDTSALASTPIQNAAEDKRLQPDSISAIEYIQEADGSCAGGHCGSLSQKAVSSDCSNGKVAHDCSGDQTNEKCTRSQFCTGSCCDSGLTASLPACLCFLLVMTFLEVFEASITYAFSVKTDILSIVNGSDVTASHHQMSLVVMYFAVYVVDLTVVVLCVAYWLTTAYSSMQQEMAVTRLVKLLMPVYIFYFACTYTYFIYWSVIAAHLAVNHHAVPTETFSNFDKVLVAVGVFGLIKVVVHFIVFLAAVWRYDELRPRSFEYALIGGGSQPETTAVNPPSQETNNATDVDSNGINQQLQHPIQMSSSQTKLVETVE